MQINVFTDGGSRGNPGDAGIGGIIYSESGAVLHEFSKYIGVATNNEAEYSALFTALEWILQNFEKENASIVTFYLDSKLVVEQMNRNWKIKEPRMRILAQKCWDVVEKISAKSTFVHVRREKNKEADLLVNQALDAHQL